MSAFPNTTQQKLDAGGLALGMGMILSGGDLSFLMVGAKARTAFLRGANLSRFS